VRPLDLPDFAAADETSLPNLPTTHPDIVNPELLAFIRA